MLSIIIPCFNSENYIQRAINSIIRNPLKDLEVIVIDDGSTDKTFQIVNEISSKDKRVKLFHKENGGYPSAVNYGLDRIEGNYFMVLGSDDEIMEGFLTNVYKYLREDKYDIVFFRTIINDFGNLKKDTLTNFENISSYENINIQELEKINKYCSNACLERDTSRLYKTSKLNKLRYVGRYGIDSDGTFSSLYCHEISSFLFLPIDGYLWNKREESLSYAPNPLYLEDRIFVWSNYFEIVLNLNKRLLCDKEFGYLCFYIKLLYFYRRTYFLNFRKGKFLKQAIKKLNLSKEIKLKLGKRKNLFLFFPFIFRFLKI